MPHIFRVPTGHIIKINGSKGKKLECLSIGDYGKSQNIKADFLGHTSPIQGVEHGELLPLSEKWVITISTQYGCSMGCKFCDVPKVGPGINASFEDLEAQVDAALALHPEVTHTDRLNLHYARMGEPTFNPAVLYHAFMMKHFKQGTVHPVVSTMLPKRNKDLSYYLMLWCLIKNKDYDGEAGLQFSINSTDNEQRNWMFNNNSLSLETISEIGKELPPPVGRKYTLNFAVTKDTILDGKRLQELFSPDKFIVKITPIHDTSASKLNSLNTPEGYTEYTPYEPFEYQAKDVGGFDTLVFIPSREEDESRITCGNALLADETEE